MAGFGEMLVSAVVQEVVSKLGSIIWEEIGLLKNFKDDMMDMKKTLEMIGAVLCDAEKRSIKDKAVSLWLKELKFIAYDIEDVMCDFESNILCDKGDDWHEKLRGILKSPMLAMARFNLTREMKKLRKQLALIAERRNQFGLSIGTGFNYLDVIKQRETVAHLEESVIVGRVEEKEKIISWILKGSDEDQLSAVSIVGLGGSGKTTFVKMIYNDERVKNFFDKQAWVYVSMEFDLKKIGEAIISEVRGVEGSNLDNLQNVFRCIRNYLNCKFLIILDDVWTDDEENLKKLKLMLNCGSKGSKIIVTSRTTNVARLLGGLLHRLEPLSDDDCWKLVKRKLFGHQLGECNSSLEGVNWGIALDIVKRCGGIPLVANSLGSLIRVMGGPDAWRDMRNNNMWLFVDDESRPETKVLNWLKLTYYHMPSYLKVCFAYCAIFPKGFRIDMHKLIHQWIAMGYIKQIHGNLAPEKIGEMYVNSLLDMSFLQTSTYIRKLYIHKLYMHDLVHDLARSIVGDELLVLDGGMAINASLKTKDCRYVLVELVKMPVICQALPNKVRALHFCDWYLLNLPGELFTHTKCLRVLSFSRNLYMKVFDSFTQLNQLRYLHAPRINIEKISKNTSHHNNISFLDFPLSDKHSILPVFNNLQNLCYLKIRHHCFLKIMPESIGELKMLRHLELPYFTQLRSLPESIGVLSCLQVLNLSHCYSLEKLPESLNTLINLEHLNLSVCRELGELPENLGELRNLQVLNLSDCGRIESLPSSIGYLVKLEVLNLRSCASFKALPESFSNLIKIQELDLSYCNSLDCLPSSIANLTSLKILDCRFELWGSLPSNIDHLVNLQTLPIFSVCNETTPNGMNCSNIVKLMHLNKVRGSLKIECLENVLELEEAERANLSNKMELHSLELAWTKNLKYKPRSCSDEMVLEKLQPHCQLKSLVLKGYRAAKLPGWLANISSLPNLASITISHLPRLERLPTFGQLANLENLTIECLPSVTRIDEASCPDGLVFRKLRQLWLFDMRNLEEFLFPSGNKNEFILPNLETLYLSVCPKLRVKPGLPRCDDIHINWGSLVLTLGNNLLGTSPCCKLSIDFEGEVSDGFEMLQIFGELEELEIKNCIKMVTLLSGIRFLISPRSLVINNCYDKALPEWLGDLTSLQTLEIYSCYNLETLPLSMQNLTSLKQLEIKGCNPMLFELCLGADRMKIVHIPHVTIMRDGRELAWDRTKEPQMSAGSSSSKHSYQAFEAEHVDSKGIWAKMKKLFAKQIDE